MRKIYALLYFIISAATIAQNSNFLKDSTEFRRIVSNCFDTIEDEQAFRKQFENVVKLGEKINKPFSLAHIKNLMSNYHNLNGAYDSSSFYLNEAIQILSHSNLYNMQAKCIWGISQNYFSLGDNNNGVKKLFEYLDFSKKHNLFNRQADAYYALANQFDLEGKTKLAMAYCADGITIAKKNDLKKRLSELYQLKGTIFYSMYYKDASQSQKSLSFSDSSLQYFNFAIQIATEIEDNLALGNIYNNMKLLGRNLTQIFP
jgi:tetratricopeptide (TPR) repeat protein